MTSNLPSHIETMVQKNNLVMAIKSLASEKNISMDEAKEMIDLYEESVKQKRLGEQEKINQKQEVKSKKVKSLKKILNEQGIAKSLTPYIIKIAIILVFGLVLMTAISKFLV